jgi:hypothetical protein
VYVVDDFKLALDSGKHNTWPLPTASVASLFLSGLIHWAINNNLRLPVGMVIMIDVFCGHGYLLRMSSTSPGNNFCFGDRFLPSRNVSMQRIATAKCASI